MRDEIRKKVLLELFVSPLTLVPVLVGLSGLIISGAVSSIGLAVFSTMSVMVGCGIFATKLIFGLEKITENAVVQILNQTELDKNHSFDQLDDKLREDRDPRPERCLKNLRSMRQLIRESVDHKFSPELIDNFETLFESCVQRIHQTDELWRSYRNLTGKSKTVLKDRREELIVEVEKIASEVSENIEHLTLKCENDNVSESLKELQRSIEVARETETFLTESKNYDSKEFE